MTLASRLAEDGNVTVAVLEAGGDMHIHDSIGTLITRPGKHASYSRISSSYARPVRTGAW